MRQAFYFLLSLLVLHAPTGVHAGPSAKQICTAMIAQNRAGIYNLEDCMCKHRVALAVLDADIRDLLFDAWHTGKDNTPALENLPKRARVKKQLRDLGRSLATNCPKASADQGQFKSAQKAASICARHAPDWGAVQQALVGSGFASPTDQRLLKEQKRQRAVILMNPKSVVVLLAAKGREGACIIGIPGMTPDQAYRLALPWVSQFGALTNAERGQGVARKAVQAWGAKDKERIVYIAAYKTWDLFKSLKVPGAAARLLYIKRK